MDYKLIEEKNKIKVVIEKSEIYEKLGGHPFKILFEDLISKEKDVELDFDKVEVADSLFIGEMILLYDKLKEKHRKLIIIHLHNPLEFFFERTGLLDYLGQNI